MIKAIATAAAARPIRHPRAVDGGAPLYPGTRSGPALQHYFDMIADFADSVGVGRRSSIASCRSTSASWRWFREFDVAGW